ncbi:hypothetical protein PPSIR1_21384 [Plesiocystis pacifica SIR-1]|uniref:Uncharacterized protein n=2 Tax=Plesiocystis pacifica TaxID=191768 RepID=A6G3L6_9BACT|nr:hypothetical protein PPSIR1_21384 [Plesiocystis pacifica SIR-1]
MDNTTTMTTGALEAEDSQSAQTLTDAQAPYPDEREGLTPGQKVGIGLGATAALGLAGFGLYKLGQRNGWWMPDSPLVIDDETTPGGGGTTPKPKPSGGGSSGTGRARGKPPNISLDPEGYNTILWPRPGPIRMAMLSQGYKVEVNDDPLNPHPQVTRFQRDWNAVIRGLESKKVRLPVEVKKSSLLRHYRGILQVDGIAGKNTLNALEVMLTNYTDNGIRWSTLTEQTR